MALAALVPWTLAGCGDLQDDPSQGQSEIIVNSSSQITQTYSNGSGTHQTFFSTANSINTTGSTITADPNNPFFQSLGTNGRACVSCHAPAQSWGITPSELQTRFNNTQGLDPIFRTNDGSNSPNLPIGTLPQRQTAFSMLTNRGVIRVGIGIPTGAQFNLTLVEDPYSFASAAQLSLFRRPLPSTNLKFLATVMWDGRETAKDPTTGAFSLGQSLTNQANDATLGHAQAAASPTAAQLASIVAFETALFTAQVTDNAAGSLTAGGATGGPVNLSNNQFFLGINDPLGGNPTGAAFSNHVFNVYDAWSTGTPTAAQASIARGQALFNTRQINISGVRGVNDVTGITTIAGGCVTCHDTPNAGDHSVGLPLDLGLTDPNTFNTDTTPRYTLTSTAAAPGGAGQVIRTSDPGRALITGKWANVATFKGPILRGLASRPPYFHNGFAATLLAVVQFYDTRFHIGFTAQEQQDLANFLATL